MNFFEACTKLDIWDAVRVRLEVQLMSNSEDFYFNILGMARDAFKKLALKHHPDHGGVHSNYIEIQEAHNIIKGSTEREMLYSINDAVKANKIYYIAGSEHCIRCARWSTILNNCAHTKCEGFQELRKPKFSKIKGSQKDLSTIP